MRFLIGCYEICGLIRTYSEELKKQGHHVTTIADKNAFFDYSYDYPLTNLKYDYFKKKTKTPFFQKLFFKFSELMEKCFPKLRLYLILLSLARKTDVYIYIWEGFVPDKYLFRILKLFSVKTIVLFLGDEVRNFTALSSEFDVSPWVFPEHYAQKSVEESIMKLRYAEKYADLIYSVPDQMGFAVRPYFHLHLPVDVSAYYFKNHFRKVPIVLHLPSEPFIKGSDVIMETLKELKEEGLEFEIMYKSRIPHEEVKTVLAEVDILVDEIILHGPGVLAMEAMASGCAVATNHLEMYSGIFGPPVCSVNYKNIKEKVRELILNYDYRQELITKGYEYVSRECAPSVVVSNILNDLNTDRTSGQYVPGFYKNKFAKPEALASVFRKADKLYSN